MNIDYFKRLEKIIAIERLDAYRQDGVDELDTFSRYLWNMALCEALYSPLQMAEIALRNAIHTALSEMNTTQEWYATGVSLLPWQQDQVKDAIRVLSKGGKTPRPGQIVAALHFGFWTGFFNKANSKTGIAPSLVKPVFKYASKYERKISLIGRRWNEIRTLRNRVFHHERIVHWSDLSQQHTNIIQTIGWISPDLKEMAEALDRFTMMYSAGSAPWKEKIQQHWPKEVSDA